MEIIINRTCRTHTGHTFNEGDIISEPECILDILLKLGYAEIYEQPKPVRKNTKKISITEDQDGR